ncbi:Tubulin polyglutamylase TTLL4, partial [Trichostrongylus colubriformis]
MGYNVTSGAAPVEWDVLWTHEYSLMKDHYMSAIREAKANQIVNHVAGSGFYTSKVWLATSQSLKGIPKSFKLPKQKKELLMYADQHPHITWILKDNSHRNIQVMELKDMNLDKENSFVQKFVNNPLLIDNRKFDIGVYTVITSIRPLRIYVYEGDSLIRFCAEDYVPFDSTRLNKYVVGDDYTPIWEIPSLKRLFTEQKLGWRASIDAYLRLNGMNSKEIWTQIHHIIVEVFRNQQPKMLTAAKSISSKAKFFELSRFDFIVDEQLNVFLMEVSPRGQSDYSEGQKRRMTFSDAEPSQDFIVPDSEIYVPLKECVQGLCSICDEL